MRSKYENCETDLYPRVIAAPHLGHFCSKQGWPERCDPPVLTIVANTDPTRPCSENRKRSHSTIVWIDCCLFIFLCFLKSRISIKCDREAIKLSEVKGFSMNPWIFNFLASTTTLLVRYAVIKTFMASDCSSRVRLRNSRPSKPGNL